MHFLHLNGRRGWAPLFECRGWEVLAPNGQYENVVVTLSVTCQQEGGGVDSGDCTTKETHRFKQTWVFFGCYTMFYHMRAS